MIDNAYFTHIMPEADRLALVQQPDPPVESVATTDLPQTDSAVVELAIILTLVDAISATVVLVILVTSATGSRRRRGRRGKARKFRQAREFGKVRETRKKGSRRSVDSSSQGSDSERLRRMHDRRKYA